MMGFEFILEPFKYDFMVRSMYVAILVGIMLPLLGAYVINRNLGFTGDAIAHASFPGLVFGVMIGVSIFVVAIPVAILIALLIGFMINKKIGEDTAIGITFSSLFALGFILLSIFDGVLLNIEDVLLGQILGVSDLDVLFTSILSLIVVLILFIFHKQFLFFSFDRKGAEVGGLNPNLLNNIYLIILSLAIMGSLQSVGIILVLSMLITPAAAAKILLKNFSRSMILGSLFGVIASMSGLYLSYYLDFPSGPSMALVATSIFIVVWVSKRTVSFRK
jgi:manganese/iron transport system permease protein